MNITLTTVGIVILAIIAGLWAFGYRSRKAGENDMAAKVTKATVDVLVKQDQAAAKAPKTKDELVDRLRKGGF